MRSVFTMLAFACTLGLQAQDHDERAVADILRQQVSSWNRGNIDAFMKGYWNNDSLMFVGKAGVTYGYSNTLQNYKKAYRDTTEMGKLSFETERMTRVSLEYFFVVGKWHLARSIGDLHGHFTLLIRKILGEWKIVADHSS